MCKPIAQLVQRLMHFRAVAAQSVDDSPETPSKAAPLREARNRVRDIHSRCEASPGHYVSTHACAAAQAPCLLLRVLGAGMRRCMACQTQRLSVYCKQL